MGTLVIWAVLLACSGIAAYVRYQQAQARTAELEAFCASKGWRFSREDEYGLVGHWNGRPFGVGRRRRARNVVTTEVDGRELLAFEYSYVVRQGKRSKTYHYAVVALAMPCALPELHVGPEDAITRLGGVLGLADIDLESEAFNRAFRVRCPSPKFAHDVLTPRTMQALLSIAPVEFRFAGRDALCYELGYLEGSTILAQVAALRLVVNSIPSFVWRDHGVDV